MNVRRGLEVQVFFSNYYPSEEMFSQVRNRTKSEKFMKPHGGLWTSTYNKDSFYMSSWHRHCAHTNFGYIDRDDKSKPPGDAYLLYPKNVGKVLEVDSKDDVIRFFEKYKKKNSNRNVYYIDFEELANKYYGLRLTDNGACALSMLADENNKYYNILEWDCESTLWLRFCFDDWEKLYEKQI